MSTGVQVNDEVDAKGRAYHELLLNLAKAVQTRLQLQMVVGRRLSNSRHNCNVVALGAYIVC